MRTLASLRNYCLLVFFLVVVGGAILRPAPREAEAPSQVAAALVP